MGYAAAYINLFLIDEVGDNEYVIKGAELGDMRSRWQLGRSLAFGLNGMDVDYERAVDLLGSLPD